MDAERIPLSSIERIDCQPCDTLFVRVGLTAEETGGNPWIPTDEELEEVKQAFTRAIPDVKVVVAHCGIKAVGIGGEDG